MRYVLDEEREGERWSTSLTVIVGHGEQYLWIDVERVTEDAYGKPPTLKPPRLMNSLLATGTATIGPTALLESYRTVDREGVPVLLRELLHPDRSIPIAVVSADWRHPSAGRDRGEALARVLVGIAPVYVLADTVADDQLNAGLGDNLKVYGGATRTYLPGLTVPDAQPWRHRILGRDKFETDPRDGAALIARALAARAVTMRPPEIYRRLASRQPGLLRPGSADVDSLLEELYAAQRKLAELEDDLIEAVLDADAQARRAGRAEGRVSYLEDALAERGDYKAAKSMTPEPEVPETASSCVEALEWARDYLARLEIGDTLDEAEALDRHVKATTWGRKAWQALRALDAYAVAKSANVCASDFRGFCVKASPGSRTIPTEWVVPLDPCSAHGLR